MLLFMSLIVPMPFKMKRGLFEFISSNPLVAKLQYGMKVWHVKLGVPQDEAHSC